jgi:hypothetical protein
MTFATQRVDPYPSRFVRDGWIVLSLSLAAVVCMPRTAVAYQEAFEGEMVNLRGDGRTHKGAMEIGGQMSSRGADDTYLFALDLGREAQSYLVLLWRRAPGAPKDWTALDDKAIVETWLWTDPLMGRVLASPEQFNEQRDFLNVTLEQRKRIKGAYLLKGKVHIRRFVSNVDFQIDLDVATDTQPPRKLKGTLYSRGSRPEGAAAAAAEPVPKKPAAAPAGVDLSEPLKAVRAYAEALRDGDAAKLKSVHHTAGKEWDDAIDLFAQWAKSSARLERAAVAKFGRAGADRVMASLLLPPPGERGRDMLDSLDGRGLDPEVEVRGDRASVYIEPVGYIQLRRVGGQWGIFDTGNDTGVGAGGQPKAEHGPVLKILIAAQDSVAPEIEAGRIGTAGEAVKAVERTAKEKAKSLGVAIDDEEVDDEAK